MRPTYIDCHILHIYIYVYSSLAYYCVIHKMAQGVTRRGVLKLYKQLLRQGEQFVSFNYRLVHEHTLHCQLFSCCKVKAGNFGKLVIPRTFLFFSVSRLIGVKGTRIDAEYGNNLSTNLLRLFSLCTENYKTFPKLPAFTLLLIRRSRACSYTYSNNYSGTIMIQERGLGHRVTMVQGLVYAHKMYTWFHNPWFLTRLNEKQSDQASDTG